MQRMSEFFYGLFAGVTNIRFADYLWHVVCYFLPSLQTILLRIWVWKPEAELLTHIIAAQGPLPSRVNPFDKVISV